MNNADKTLFGNIESFDLIFKDAKYLPTKPGRSADIIHPQIFLSMDFTARPYLPPSFTPDHKGILVCTPVIELPKFAPYIRSNSNQLRPAGSIKIIAWEKRQAFLVIATDPNCIADAWLGFVPMAQRFEVQDGTTR